MPTFVHLLPPFIHIEERVKPVAKRWVKKMLRSSIREHDAIKFDDNFAMGRDGSGWLFPTRATKLAAYFFEVVHNGPLKTSGINRTCLLSPDGPQESNKNSNFPYRALRYSNLSDSDEEDLEEVRENRLEHPIPSSRPVRTLSNHTPTCKIRRVV